MWNGNIKTSSQLCLLQNHPNQPNHSHILRWNLCGKNRYGFTITRHLYHQDTVHTTTSPTIQATPPPHKTHTAEIHLPRPGKMPRYPPRRQSLSVTMQQWQQFQSWRTPQVIWTPLPHRILQCNHNRKEWKYGHQYHPNTHARRIYHHTPKHQGKNTLLPYKVTPENLHEHRIRWWHNHWRTSLCPNPSWPVHELCMDICNECTIQVQCHPDTTRVILYAIQFPSMLYTEFEKKMIRGAAQK